MEEKKINDDMMIFINFMKTAFNATLENITEIQDLSENFFLEMTGKGKQAQQETEEAIKEFISNAKRGREEFKNIMESGFQKMEEVVKKKNK
jgi:polyhydroxyalkanoate synthesis regulator phasin